MTDLDELLEANPAVPETALGGTATPRKCRHVWATQTIAYFDGNGDPVPSPVYCIHCLRPRDPIRSRRGRQSRNYGNRAELTVARTVSIRIAGRPPLPNTDARRNWRVAATHNVEWKRRANTEATLAKPHGWLPLERATMAVEFIVPDHRRRDLDNLVASTKALTDGIVAAGILIDDSTEVLSAVSYSVRYEKGVTATVYTISGDS